MKISCDESRMINFIKSLLCLGNNSSYYCVTTTHKLTIEFKGSCFKVQKNILEWLDIPERKQNMEMRGN